MVREYFPKWNVLKLIFCFLEWTIPGPFFLYFRLFSTVDSKQMFNKNFADGWIRTADLLS